jgi:hypothetical protein
MATMGAIYSMGKQLVTLPSGKTWIFVEDKPVSLVATTTAVTIASYTGTTITTWDISAASFVSVSTPRGCVYSDRVFLAVCGRTAAGVLTLLVNAISVSSGTWTSLGTSSNADSSYDSTYSTTNLDVYITIDWSDLDAVAVGGLTVRKSLTNYLASTFLYTPATGTTSWAPRTASNYTTSDWSLTSTYQQGPLAAYGGNLHFLHKRSAQVTRISYSDLLSSFVVDTTPRGSGSSTPFGGQMGLLFVQNDTTAHDINTASEIVLPSYTSGVFFYRSGSNFYFVNSQGRYVCTTSAATQLESFGSTSTAVVGEVFTRWKRATAQMAFVGGYSTKAFMNRFWEAVE